MSEPDVTLTDYALTLECAVLAVRMSLSSPRTSPLHRAGALFFVFLGLSAATGGTVHGFCSDRSTLVCRSLWTATLLLVGLAGLCIWQVGARIVSLSNIARPLALAGWPQLALFVANVLLLTQGFWIAFTIYLPAALLLLAGFLRRAGSDRQRGWFVGASGSVLSLTSSALQFLQIGIHPVYFNHNALAHVVQGVALGMLFVGIRHASRWAVRKNQHHASNDVPR